MQNHRNNFVNQNSYSRRNRGSERGRRQPPPNNQWTSCNNQAFNTNAPPGELLRSLAPSDMQKILMNYLVDLKIQERATLDSPERYALQAEQQCTEFLLKHSVSIDFLSLSNSIFTNENHQIKSRMNKYKYIRILLLWFLSAEGHRRTTVDSATQDLMYVMNFTKYKVLMQVQQLLQFCVYYLDTWFVQGMEYTDPLLCGHDSGELGEWCGRLAQGGELLSRRREDILFETQWTSQYLKDKEKMILKMKEMLMNYKPTKGKIPNKMKQEPTEKTNARIAQWDTSTLFLKIKQSFTACLDLKALLLHDSNEEYNADTRRGALHSALQAVFARERCQAEEHMFSSSYWEECNTRLVTIMNSTFQDFTLLLEVRPLLTVFKFLLGVDDETMSSEHPNTNKKKHFDQVSETQLRINQFRRLCLSSQTDEKGGKETGDNKKEKHYAALLNRLSGGLDSFVSYKKKVDKIELQEGEWMEEYIQSMLFDWNKTKNTCIFHCFESLFDAFDELQRRLQDVKAAMNSTEQKPVTEGMRSYNFYDAFTYHYFHNPHYSLSDTSLSHYRCNRIEGMRSCESGNRFEHLLLSSSQIRNQLKYNILVPHCVTHATLDGSPVQMAKWPEVRKEAENWVEAFLVDEERKLKEKESQAEENEPVKQKEIHSYTFDFPDYALITNLSVVEKTTFLEKKEGGEKDTQIDPTFKVKDIKYTNKGELDVVIFDRNTKNVIFIIEMKLNFADLPTAEKQRDTFFSHLDTFLTKSTSDVESSGNVNIKLDEKGRAPQNCDKQNHSPASPEEGSNKSQKATNTTTVVKKHELLFGRGKQDLYENSDTDYEEEGSRETSSKCHATVHHSTDFFTENFRPYFSLESNKERIAHWLYITSFSPDDLNLEKKGVARMPAKGNQRHMLEEKIGDCLSFPFTYYYTFFIKVIITDFIAQHPWNGIPLSRSQWKNTLRAFIDSRANDNSCPSGALYSAFRRLPPSFRGIIDRMFESSFVFGWLTNETNSKRGSFQFLFAVGNGMNTNDNTNTPLEALKDINEETFSDSSPVVLQDTFFEDVLNCFGKDETVSNVFLQFFYSLERRLSKVHAGNKHSTGKGKPDAKKAPPVNNTTHTAAVAKTSNALVDMLPVLINNHCVRNVLFHDFNLEKEAPVDERIA